MRSQAPNVGVVPESTLDIQRQLSNTDTAINSLSRLDFVPEPSIPPLTTNAFSAPTFSQPSSPVPSKDEPITFIADTDSRQWILDTGTNRFIVNDVNLLTNFSMYCPEE